MKWSKNEKGKRRVRGKSKFEGVCIFCKKCWEMVCDKLEAFANQIMLKMRDRLKKGVYGTFPTSRGMDEER
jgi:hypothetical protein